MYTYSIIGLMRINKTTRSAHGHSAQVDRGSHNAARRALHWSRCRSASRSPCARTPDTASSPAATGAGRVRQPIGLADRRESTSFNSHPLLCSETSRPTINFCSCTSCLRCVGNNDSVANKRKCRAEALNMFRVIRGAYLECECATRIVQILVL